MKTKIEAMRAAFRFIEKNFKTKGIFNMETKTNSYVITARGGRQTKFSFKPPVSVPPSGAPVFVSDRENYEWTAVAISTGRINDGGFLICYEDSDSGTTEKWKYWRPVYKPVLRPMNEADVDYMTTIYHKKNVMNPNSFKDMLRENPDVYFVLTEPKK